TANLYCAIPHLSCFSLSQGHRLCHLIQCKKIPLFGLSVNILKSLPKDIFRKKSIGRIIADTNASLDDGHGISLNKVLTVRDLTALGIAAVIGAGIFSTVGKACFDGGPGVIFLFMITAVVCAFSALCYAEFASRVPISGSAYTYSYVAFG